MINNGTTKQHNTTTPETTLFPKKNELLRWDLNPRHSMTCTYILLCVYWEGTGILDSIGDMRGHYMVQEGREKLINTHTQQIPYSYT